MDDPAEDFGQAAAELLRIVQKLRGPDGCSWDREQTVESLSPFMLEEAYEVADAISSSDAQMLKGELGDLLLHIIMSAFICSEKGEFTPADVVRAVPEKLIRRHPHVFEKGRKLSPREVEMQWEAIKSREKVDEGFFGSIPSSMPALQTAWRIQQRASEVGFDWPDHRGAREKISEELVEFEEALQSDDEHAQKEELGDLLFSLVNYCRLMGFEPESALRSSNMKFISRFSKMEKILRESETSLDRASLDAMENAWNMAKLKDPD